MVVAPTTAFLEEIRRLHGVRGRMRAIPNGRDGASFAPDFKQPFVLAAGRPWDEAKNVATLDRAAKGLPWPVLVAGDDRHPGGGGVRPHHARPLGRLAPGAVAGWLSRAAVYALPARYEPFGLSALEAGLSGCALVRGDVPSLREVRGDAAMFVPPDDARALHRALGRLAADASLRTELAGRAMDRARRYTPERLAEAYLSTYRALARPRPRGGERRATVEDSPCGS